MSKVNWEKADTEGVWIGEMSEPGPTVGVIGGVHGDEGAGSLVVDESRFRLSLDCGTLILMKGNPEALKCHERYVDVNLNRSFRTLTDEEQGQDLNELPYEVRRAQDLLPYLDDCQALLDLHEHQYLDSGPFIICEPNAFDTARAIGAPVISYGWAKTEPGGTDSYMAEQGKEGLCYELGAKQRPTPNIKLGHAVVEGFLSAQGLKEEQFSPLYGNPDFIAVKHTFTRTDTPYSLAREFRCFERLRDGELIAIDGELAAFGGRRKSIYAVEGDIIIFPDRAPKLGAEAFTIGHKVEPPTA